MPDYHDLVRQLADVDDHAAAAVSHAHRSFHARHDAAVAEVVRAEDAVRRAESSVQAAHRRVEAIDDRALGLWNELCALLGRPGRRLGPLPEPSFELPPRVSASVLLDRASGMIRQAATDPRHPGGF